MISRRLALLSVALVLRTSSAYAQTQVIGFEGLPFGGLPQGYAGMEWSTGFNVWGVIASASDPGAPYRYSPASGTANAFSGENSSLYMWSLEGSFNLNYLFLAAANRGMGCTHATGVSASKAGVEKYSMVLEEPLCGNPVMQRYDLEWLDVDRVVFGTTTGNVLLDDISVTATPEPGTILLVGTGLAGVVGVARRRRSRTNE